MMSIDGRCAPTVARSRRRTAWLLGLLSLLAAPSPAWAKADNRPEDRFFFALFGGVALGRANQMRLVDPMNAALTQQAAARAPVLGPLAGIETSFWPCDYAAVGVDFHVYTAPSPTSQYTPVTTDWGLLLLLAVPLRYVQPYAGVRGGLRVSAVAGQGSGVLPMVHPVAGLNIYAHRNVRLFVQWQYVPFDYDVQGSKFQITYAGADVHLLATGIRVSPDFFHAARGAMKADWVWWSMLLGGAAWGLGSWLGSKG